MEPWGQRSHGLRTLRPGFGCSGRSISPERTSSYHPHFKGLIDHPRTLIGFFKGALFSQASGSRGRSVKLGRMPGLIELGGVTNARRWPRTLLCLSPFELIRSRREAGVCVSGNLKQTPAVCHWVNGGEGGKFRVFFLLLLPLQFAALKRNKLQQVDWKYVVISWQWQQKKIAMEKFKVYHDPRKFRSQSNEVIWLN